MGSNANRLRKKWQDYGGANATVAEHSFYDIFNDLFKDTEFEIELQPTKFKDIYLNVELSHDELSQIYIPDKPIIQHGIKPDCLIRNKETGKEIYVEIKRQDGWVEGKTRSAGRGNAHERLCKYFTPGLFDFLRSQSGIAEPNYPFWIVFQGDITRDICRVKEIRCWFKDNTANVTFWRDTTTPTPLLTHFFEYILPMMED
jgi:hypothetical protein